MRVPFVDLQRTHEGLYAELDAAMRGVMTRGDFVLGEEVGAFEKEFAAYCGSRFGVGVDSGLSALELGLRAFGVGPGDEVIVPSHTFIATAAAATFAGATPVLVDVEEESYNLDVSQVEAAITERTRAIIPVHLYGLPANMDGVMRVAEKHGLTVIEDASQAHGATYKGQRVGCLGHAGAFSFYPTKNLGAAGDAGMLVTNDAEAAERVRAMGNVGQRKRYHHELPPFNHRLDTLQAAVLRVKLRYLEGWTEARRRNAALYDELLRGSELVTPVETPGCQHVYHLYVVRTRERERLQAHLQGHGVSTAIHYPVPV
ncbi:MAG TPA: DegT/DnrJ/EryC1/StrS family aminotransferase, partial [Anaerolineae bacterium]|nr:DegT/DnrJ/EryC1/StrS family aminotransferase [Anaerolineae bacterium]